MRIHFLQHVPYEGPASLEDWIRARRHEFSISHIYKGDPLPEIESLDWLIIMGGPMNIYEDTKYPWLKDEKLYIEKSIAHGKIVIGICLGAQLIAHVLGAQVFRNRHKEIGWFPATLTGEAKNSRIMNSFPRTFTPFHWHGDTFSIPEGSLHIAFSEGCNNQAFIYEDRVVALQFHLETTRESAEALIRHCGDEIVEGEYIQQPEEMIGNDKNFAAAHSVMEIFLENMEGAG